MNPKEVPPGILNQRWLHSHEEDTESEKVFRLASYQFPPSRGRIGFELRQDGNAAVVGIAPTDGPQESEGTWTIDENGQLLIRLPGFGPAADMSVVSMSSNRLTVMK